MEPFHCDCCGRVSKKLRFKTIMGIFGAVVKAYCPVCWCAGDGGDSLMPFCCRNFSRFQKVNYGNLLPLGW